LSTSYVQRVASARGLFALSTVFIVYATTLPFDFSRAPSLVGANLIPLWDEERNRLHSMPDIVQNIVLFMPFGFFMTLGFPRKWPVLRAAVAGFLLSLLAESLQTMTTIRQTSATDLTTNTAGALVGATAAVIWGALLEDVARTRLARMVRSDPGLVIVLGVLGMVVFSMLAPFIPTLDIGALRGQVRSLIDHPWGTRPIGALMPELVLYAGLGFALTHEVPARLKVASPVLRVVAGSMITATIALVLEAAQMPLLFHRPAGADVVANALGGFIGAMMVLVIHRGRAFAVETELGAWTRRWPALVLTFAVLSPVSRAFSPFVFRSVADGLAMFNLVHLVPFSLLFESLKISTFLNVFETASTYLPLGYALCVLRVRTPVAFGITILLAEIMEIAQIVVEGRTTDVTEGLLAAAGAVAGWSIALHLETVAAAPSVGESSRR